MALFAQERFSIEVICVKDKSSISDAFMQKVNETDLPFTTHHVQDKYHVIVGDFVSIEEAKATLPKIQEQVSKDAFVTTGMSEVVLDPQKKMIQTMVLAQARALKASKEEPVQTQEIEGLTQENPKQKKSMKKVEKEKVSEEVICTTTKKALRKEEISRALSFYKNSSYYSFSN